ncbi:hypothetical protein TVAG_264780 [Trichomonas vaginalis G3]|uniref:Uncharacterized protein n=1 Tax=Trichomonas vaginalis (strain ATCC PRA-98 / G3) TaxID=412133 RepID=A2F9K0_TRIV3|nr:hypothetical protein TVAGG3_0276820 [Trichomonas vaginalis G3]EAX98429.1 hypothetical protein TVAG_264780 [Trichomonas vaginalis G3]KAI5526275.1 hypothetical protein TVAGG3_0276820 [Trichomonas vaginalis G3]|eukprot:XP_001311359.1 hypothetical protein [Trichomonas vaginalis G3]
MNGHLYKCYLRNRKSGPSLDEIFDAENLLYNEYSGKETVHHFSLSEYSINLRHFNNVAEVSSEKFVQVLGKYNKEHFELDNNTLLTTWNATDTSNNRKINIKYGCDPSLSDKGAITNYYSSDRNINITFSTPLLCNFQLFTLPNVTYNDCFIF